MTGFYWVFTEFYRAHLEERSAPGRRLSLVTIPLNYRLDRCFPLAAIFDPRNGFHIFRLFLFIILLFLGIRVVTPETTHFGKEEDGTEEEEETKEEQVSPTPIGRLARTAQHKNLKRKEKGKSSWKGAGTRRPSRCVSRSRGKKKKAQKLAGKRLRSNKKLATKTDPGTRSNKMVYFFLEPGPRFQKNASETADESAFISDAGP